jgi:hypothetical protein
MRSRGVEMFSLHLGQPWQRACKGASGGTECGYSGKCTSRQIHFRTSGLRVMMQRLQAAG